MSKASENKLIDEFRDKESFAREELFYFHRHFEPELRLQFSYANYRHRTSRCRYLTGFERAL